MKTLKLFFALATVATVIAVTAIAAPGVYTFSGTANSTNSFTIVNPSASNIKIKTDNPPVTLHATTTITNVSAERIYTFFATSTEKEFLGFLKKNANNTIKISCTGVYTLSICTFGN